MRMRKLCGTMVVVVLCVTAPAMAVEPEKGPAYLTDSHGASGVALAFLELSKTSPEYAKYWKGSLDWLLHVAQRDQQGRMAWIMSTSAPKGHPSHQISIPGTCGIVKVFFDGYEACGDARYKDAGVAGARMLVEEYAIKKQTPLGTAYGWMHSYRPGAKGPGLLAGHSHGLGNMIDAILTAHEAAPRDEFEHALEGILVNLKMRGKQIEGSGREMFAWPATKNPDVCETGYCYGQAGIALPLLRLAEAMPELKLSDGTTPLDLANANLRYLMSIARGRGDGYVWPYMRHDRSSRNIGYGSGTGGIGWALLRGAQVNRPTDPDFSAECMRYARGAAVFAVELVESQKRKRPLTSPGGDAGFGVCGGAGGGGHFLMLFAEEVREKDAALAGRIDAVIERIARAVSASAVEFEDGSLACPDRVNFKRINLALDYGQTGVVLGLAVAGRYLDSEEICQTAEKVADYIVHRAVPEGGGLKFAQFHPLPK